MPGENLSAKRKHLMQVKFIEDDKLFGNFLHRIQEPVGRKLNFLCTLLFCFEILLPDDELFSSFEVLNGKFIFSYWWLHIKVQLLQQRPKQEYMVKIAFVILPIVFLPGIFSYTLHPWNFNRLHSYP